MTKNCCSWLANYEMDESKVPVVVINPKLAELDKVVLFPDKVAKAKATIARIGLPTKR